MFRKWCSPLLFVAWLAVFSGFKKLDAANVADWVYFSARQGSGLPKVVGPSRKVLHGPPADREEFFRIIRDFIEL